MLTIVADDAHGFNVLEQQPMYEPEQAGPSVAGPSTAPFPLSAGQSPSRQPATFTGPAHTSSPVPTLSWGRKFLFYLLMEARLLTDTISLSPSLPIVRIRREQLVW